MVSADAPSAPPIERHRWLPFGDPSRRHRLVTVLAWLVGLALAVGLLELLGVNVRGWIRSTWDALTEIGVGYLFAGWALQTAQTTLTALGWFFILRAAYPRAPVPYPTARSSRRTRPGWP